MDRDRLHEVSSSSNIESPPPPSVFSYYMESKRAHFMLPEEMAEPPTIEGVDTDYFDIQRGKRNDDDDVVSNAGSQSSLLSDELQNVCATYAIPTISTTFSQTQAHFLGRFARPYDKVVMLVIGGESKVTEEIIQELGPLDVTIHPVTVGKSKHRSIVDAAMLREVDVLVLPPPTKSMFGGADTSEMFHGARGLGLMITKGEIDNQSRRWLLCVNGSKESQTATELLVRLVGSRDYVCVFSCITIPTNSPQVTPAYQKAKEDEAIEFTKRAEKTIGHRHLEHVTRYIVLTTSKPAHTAIAYAEKQGIDVIVCGRSKPTALDKIGITESFSDTLVKIPTKHTVLVACRK